MTNTVESLGDRVRSKLLKGGAWAFLGKALTGVTGVAINAVLARLLSPQDVGAFFLLSTIILFASTPARLGFERSLVRTIADAVARDEPARARAALGVAMKYSSLLSLAIALGLVAVMPWLAIRVFGSPALATTGALAGAWLALHSIATVAAEAFRGFHDIKNATLYGGLAANVLSTVVFAALWLMLGHTNFQHVLWAAVAVRALAALGACGVLYRRAVSLPAGGSVKRGELMADTWPFLSTNLVMLMYTQADLWLLGAFRSESDVAIYGAAARLVGLVALPIGVVNAVLPPIIAELSAKRKLKELERAVRVAATYTAIPSALLLLPLVLWGRSILGLLYGSYYSGGATVLAVLAVAQLVNVWVGSAGITQQKTGHALPLLWLTVVAMLIATVGGWLTVQRFGLMGVAWSTASARIFLNVAAFLTARTRVGIWTHAQVQFWKPR